MPVRDIESVGQELIDLFKSDLPAALNVIDAEKADDIILEDVVRFSYGVDLVSGEYPMLSVISMRETFESEHTRWFHLSCELYTTSDDATALERMSNRYARAIKLTLRANYEDDGFVDSCEYPPVLSRGDALYKGVAVLFRILVPLV